MFGRRHPEPTTTSTPADVRDSGTTLTALDRCDRCNAQAFVEVAVATERGALPLLFCGHHFAVHQAKVSQIGTVLVDERHRLREARP